jgi:hypothetical protein
MQANCTSNTRGSLSVISAIRSPRATPYRSRSALAIRPTRWSSSRHVGEPQHHGLLGLPDHEGLQLRHADMPPRDSTIENLRRISAAIDDLDSLD